MDPRGGPQARGVSFSTLIQLLVEIMGFKQIGPGKWEGGES